MNQDNNLKKKKIRKILLIVLFIIINVGVIIYTILGDFSNSDSISIKDVLKIFKDNWYYLLYAVFCFLAYILCRSLTYMIMMKSTTGKFNFGLCLAVVVQGKYYDSITPFATGGQPFQIYYLQKKNLPGGVAISLPLGEYIINSFSFVLLSIIAVILNFTNLFDTSAFISNGILIIAIAGIFFNCLFPVIFLIFCISEKACQKLIKVVVGFLKLCRLTKKPDELYQKIIFKLEQNSQCIKEMALKKRIIVCFIFAILSNLALCSIVFFSLKTFSYNNDSNFITEWLHVLILAFFIHNASAIMPTPGNAGAADLSFYWLFNTSLVVGTAAAAMLTWRFISYYLFIIAGLILIIASSFKKRKIINHDN